MSEAHVDQDPIENVLYAATDEERRMFRVYFYEGKIYDSSGHLFSSPRYLCHFVMDGSGNFYIVPYVRYSQLNGFLLRHSTPLGGRPVAAAGDVSIVGGELLDLDNQSGHYPTEPGYLMQAVSRLRDLGVDLSRTRIRDCFGRPLCEFSPGTRD